MSHLVAIDLCYPHGHVVKSALMMECWNNPIVYCFTDRMMEYWSAGVLVIKAERIIFFSKPITPILQYSLAQPWLIGYVLRY